MILICVDFEFDFLVLYRMYFQNYFANRSIKLQSLTCYLLHSRPCCIGHTTLACCKLSTDLLQVDCIVKLQVVSASCDKFANDKPDFNRLVATS